MSDFITGAIITSLTLLAAVMAWLMRQLWATKPSFREMADEFERRFDKFKQDDVATDQLLVAAVMAKLESLQTLRSDDHALLLRIYDRLNGGGGSYP